MLARKGFLVLTGDIGLGKTTISRRIIGILEEKDVATSLVIHSTYQDVELLREINRDFGLQVSSLRCSDQMRALNRFLLERSRSGKNSAIIIINNSIGFVDINTTKSFVPKLIPLSLN